MNKTDYADPDIHIFYCDKSDWYNEDKRGIRDWSKNIDRVEEFWLKVREEKMSKGDFEFSDFIFPKFGDQTFWEDNTKVFTEVVSFDRARFLGDADFSSIQFSKKAIFDNTIFSKEANFSKVKFLAEAHFAKSLFCDTTHFIWTHFSEYVDFEKVEFSGFTKFDQAEFSKNVGFFGSTFSGVCFYFTKFSDKTFFVSNTFLGEVEFSGTNFEGEYFWMDITFKKDYDAVRDYVLFSDVNFSAEKRAFFRHWQVNIPIVFRDIIFPDTVQFQSLNFKFVSFRLCDITKVSFSNCHFNKRKGRVAFYNDGNSIENMDTGYDYDNLCNTYRQLKKNLMNARDWTEAGDAYRSEMYFKRKLRWQEYKKGDRHKIIHWCIMGLHERLSGYQQSISQPLMWLFGLLLVSPALIFTIGFFFGQPCITDLHWWDQVVLAGQTSLDAALPVLGKINTKYYPNELYFLLAFERLFSVVLITFFVLSMRARLRQ